MQTNLRALALLTLCALASVLAPARAIAAPPHGAPESYVVQSGDTLYAIALRYRTTVAALRQLNNLGGSDTIRVGQKLLVPSAENSAPAATSYVVQSGDTLQRIALRFGVSTRALAELNDIPNPNLLVEGQALAIPQSTTVAKPGLTIDPPTARQGGTLLIRVAQPDAVAVAGAFNGKPIKFTRAAGYFYALVGVSRCAKTGGAPLQVTITDANGQTTENATIHIAPTAFLVQAITLPPAKAKILSDQALLQREAEQLAAIVSRYTPTRLWSGAFRQPAYSPITSAFGARRSYNGGPVGACGHEGTDFDLETGDPIYAPARGRVVFATPTQVRGNMIVIDHGLGVFSGYYHLSAIGVQNGQMVNAGDLIGKAGSTGLSTGAHLHWSVWVNGEYVDPMEWTRRVVP